jgi:hypothetical protein
VRLSTGAGAGANVGAVRALSPTVAIVVRPSVTIAAITATIATISIEHTSIRMCHKQTDKTRDMMSRRAALVGATLAAALLCTASAAKLSQKPHVVFQLVGEYL